MLKLSVVVSVVILPSVIPAVAKHPGEIVDNAVIVEMIQANVPTDLILHAIEQAKEVRFSLFPYDLISLKSSGVPDEVLRAMTARAARQTAPTSPATPSPPAPPAATRPSPPSQEMTSAGLPPDMPYLRSGTNEVTSQLSSR